MNAILVIMLLTFFAILLGVGVYSRRHASDVNGFVLGGRSVGPWLTAFAFGTSYFSAVIFVGYAGQFGWRFGIASTWVGLGNAFIGSLLPWAILGRRTRVMTQHLNSRTMPDFFGLRFQSNGLKTVACGSLVFSVPVRHHRVMHEYERDGVERRFPYCDYEMVPDSAWNYAFAGHDFRVIRQGVSDAPFSEAHPPVEIEALLQRVDWPLEDGYETVCAKLPGRTPQGAPERLHLIPYGCAKLRMTELPRLKKRAE